MSIPILFYHSHRRPPLVVKPKLFYLFALYKVCGCLNRRTVQVSQTRQWVSPNDYTDGDETAPKLNGVTKHFQQDEGAFYPHTIFLRFNRFHIVTVVSRERTRLDLKPESRE